LSLVELDFVFATVEWRWYGWDWSFGVRFWL
jgi:hypothetical protein